MTIKEIKELLSEESIPKRVIKALKEDERSGVQQLLAQRSRIENRKQQWLSQWNEMTFHERELRAEGFSILAGVDEVGRGPLAGPVAAAAVILPEGFYLPGLNDSKKISQPMRESFYEAITEQALAYSVAFVDVHIIDEINIYQATMKAICQAVDGLAVRPDICLVDGLPVKSLSVNQRAVVGGDHLSVTIAAASIVAKVTRDRWMNEAAAKYPTYGFERNVGYGTPDHLKAIAKYGPCPLHRKTFAGVKEWI